MPINNQDNTNAFDNPIVEIRGSDNLYGAKVDSEERLHVSAKQSGGSPGTIPSCTNNLSYDDMNASTGGVARGTNISTSFVTVYEYTGSGLFYGFRVSLQAFTAENWHIRLIVDGVDIFDSDGILSDDIVNTDIYGCISGKGEYSDNSIGIAVRGFVFAYHSPFPMVYDSSIELQIKKHGGDKDFNAGLVCLSKET